jgi:hypothetical protein
MRVSSPPVGTISSASDGTERPKQNSNPSMPQLTYTNAYGPRPSASRTALRTESAASSYDIPVPRSRSTAVDRT